MTISLTDHGEESYSDRDVYIVQYARPILDKCNFTRESLEHVPQTSVPLRTVTIKVTVFIDDSRYSNSTHEEVHNVTLSENEYVLSLHDEMCVVCTYPLPSIELCEYRTGFPRSFGSRTLSSFDSVMTMMDKGHSWPVNDINISVSIKQYSFVRSAGNIVTCPCKIHLMSDIAKLSLVRQDIDVDVGVSVDVDVDVDESPSIGTFSDFEHTLKYQYAHTAAIYEMVDCIRMLIKTTIDVDHVDLLRAMHIASPNLVVAMCKNLYIAEEIGNIAKSFIIEHKFIDYITLVSVISVSDVSERCIIESTMANNPEGEQYLVRLIKDGYITVSSDTFRHIGTCTAGFAAMLIDEYFIYPISHDSHVIVKHMMMDGSYDIPAKCLECLEHGVSVDVHDYIMIRSVLRLISQTKSDKLKYIYLIKALVKICNHPNLNGRDLGLMLRPLMPSEDDIINDVIVYEKSV